MQSDFFLPLRNIDFSCLKISNKNFPRKFPRLWGIVARGTPIYEYRRERKFDELLKFQRERCTLFSETHLQLRATFNRLKIKSILLWRGGDRILRGRHPIQFSKCLKIRFAETNFQKLERTDMMQRRKSLSIYQTTNFTFNIMKFSRNASTIKFQFADWLQRNKMDSPPREIQLEMLTLFQHKFDYH